LLCFALACFVALCWEGANVHLGVGCWQRGKGGSGRERRRGGPPGGVWRGMEADAEQQAAQEKQEDEEAVEGSQELSAEDLAAVAFLDDNWIRVNGLSAHNALDYFALSPFYDNRSNNEVLRVQNLGLELLQTMKGLEFRLLATGREPVLFVVVKQERISERRTNRQALYYILDKTIYQAPTLHRVLQTRLAKATNYLQNAFDELSQAVRFTPSHGYTWSFEGEAHSSWLKSSETRKYEAMQKRRDGQLERRAENEIMQVLISLQQSFLDSNASAVVSSSSASSNASSSASVSN